MRCRLHAPEAEFFLTWGPPVKVNFELATANSVHGFTMARSTWSRIIYWAGVHCARAVHVQIFYACCSFVAPTGIAVATADSKFAGHMYATLAYMVFWLPFLGVQAARARTGKVYLRGVLRF